MRENTVRSLWGRGGCVLNGWLQLPDAFASEVMAHQGWDSLTIDMQHGMIDYQIALAMLQAISTTPVMPFARVPWNEPSVIMKMLDAGCYGIICPMINTRAQCEAFVGACRYAPLGYRSMGPLRATLYGGEEYVTRANETVITMAMIETREAVDNLDDILSTPGLDAIYIGPADLGQSHGFAPRLDPVEPEVVALIKRIAAAARAHGIIAGMHTASVEYARQLVPQGMQFVTVGSDMRLMAAAAQQTTAGFHRETSTSAPQSGY